MFSIVAIKHYVFELNRFWNNIKKTNYNNLNKKKAFWIGNLSLIYLNQNNMVRLVCVVVVRHYKYIDFISMISYSIEKHF